ncbi:MAG: HNH endonuclease family protein, partial [Actinomycetota bacterium]|nr:HNH endonuclease family protein [Actinomycetota bacterium]
VLTGTLADPYTGKTIHFVRGQSTSSAVQIDHVVALGNVYVSGGQQLTQQQRVNIGNDPLNLRAVDGPANEQKSDGNAAEWLPPNKSDRCVYVSGQVAVKAKYHLSVTAPEKAAMQTVLATCPSQGVPTE